MNYIAYNAVIIHSVQPLGFTVSYELIKSKLQDTPNPKLHSRYSLWIKYLFASFESFGYTGGVEVMVKAQVHKEWKCDGECANKTAEMK